MDPRKSVFDAARAAKGDGLTIADVAVLHEAMDKVGLPRAAEVAAPAPAASSGIPEAYYPMLAQIESGTRPYIKAPTSTASGLYQFIASTWKGLGGEWGDDMSKAFGGLKPSAEEQTDRARQFTANNARALRLAGLPINKASLYAAHFFGAGMAAKVLAAAVTERADRIAGPAATRANRSILEGKTVGQFLSWLHAKTGEWAR